MDQDLETEASAIQDLLEGKVIECIFRPSQNDVCIQCGDGTRLYITAPRNVALEFSIT